MSLERIAARVAAGPVKVDVSIFEGGGYTPEDIVGSLPSSFSPLWAALTGFGWVYVNQNPATLSTDTPVEGAPFDEKTWGELLENSYVSDPDPPQFKQWASAADFAADEDVLRFICSYDESEREPMRAALEEFGFPEAAVKLPSVKF
jgi:hypothetical protein